MSVNKFSHQSEAKLVECDPRLQGLFREVVETYDCTILEGHRGQAQQDADFAVGVSKLKWPEGKHNGTPSLAVDAAPYPLDWKDLKRFYHFAGFVQAIALRRGLTIRWGGDWNGDHDFKDQNFNDLVHFELV